MIRESVQKPVIQGANQGVTKETNLDEKINFVLHTKQNIHNFVLHAKQNREMLDVNHIKTILRSNQVMVENVKVVHRDFDFYDGANFVLVGVRRAGKSFLLFQQMQHLLRIGKTWRDMLYINFEDDRLLGFETSDFERLLEAHNSMSGSDEHPMLFLDEIQNIDPENSFWMLRGIT